MAETGIVCEVCSTPEGCPEHRLFTCASCGKLVPWSDAADDERTDDCSECWMKWLAGQRSFPGVAPSDTELLEAIAHSPPRTFCGNLSSHDSGSYSRICSLPSTDTLGQTPRSWPPNTGCDPTTSSVAAAGNSLSLVPPVDLKIMAGVALLAERVRRVVNGAVFAALASDGIPEISVDASYQIADQISTRTADQFARALYSEAVLCRERDLISDESKALTAALVNQRLEPA